MQTLRDENAIQQVCLLFYLILPPFLSLSFPFPPPCKPCPILFIHNSLMSSGKECRGDRPNDWDEVRIRPLSSSHFKPWKEPWTIRKVSIFLCIFLATFLLLPFFHRCLVFLFVILSSILVLLPVVGLLVSGYFPLFSFLVLTTHPPLAPFLPFYLQRHPRVGGRG